MNRPYEKHFNGKNVVVTGGLGFIGSNLANTLVELGANVTVLDSLHKNCGGNPFNIEPFKNEIKTLYVDISSEEALAASNAISSRTDYVFSLAAKVSHVESIRNPVDDLNVNAKAELMLLEHIRHYAPNARILHTGTRQVYGRPQYSPVDEKHPVRPLDINGIHKLCAEQYHQLYHDIHGIQTTVLRLTNTYGPRQLIRRSSMGVAGNFIGQALRKEEISLFGDGSQIRDFNFISDVVDAILLAAQNPDCVGEVFNLSGYSYSLAEFLQNMASKIAINFKFVEYPTDYQKIEIGNFSASSGKLFAVTGWRPRIDLLEGLATTIEYFRTYERAYL